MSKIEQISWAVIAPPNHRSHRRYIDTSSLSWTRKGAIERHIGPFNLTWPGQRKKGWTVERVALLGLDEYYRLHDRPAAEGREDE